MYFLKIIYIVLSEKRRPLQNGKRVPVIQLYGQIRIPDGTTGKNKLLKVNISKRLFPSLMKNWLLTEKFCTTYMNARSASMSEALNAEGKMDQF